MTLVNMTTDKNAIWQIDMNYLLWYNHFCKFEFVSKDSAGEKLMIVLKQAQNKDRELLWNLLQKYLYEMTKYYSDEMEADGNYAYHYFDAYFTEPERKAYFICDGETPVGFAMINPYSYFQHPSDNVIAEFTIFPAYRGKYIALQAAQKLIDAHPGQWEIKFHESNTGAKKLWETVTAQYHPNVYHLGDDETVLEFNNS